MRGELKAIKALLVLGVAILSDLTYDPDQLIYWGIALALVLILLINFGGSEVEVKVVLGSGEEDDDGVSDA